MRVNEHGFTEKVATPSTSSPPTGKVVNNRTTETAPAATGAGDSLHLSGFTARLNSGLGDDTLARASAVSRVAATVKAGTFQIDTAAVSRSIVEEGLQAARSASPQGAG